VAVVIVAIIGLPMAELTLTGQPEILLETNIPRKVNVDQTLYALLTFTSSSDGSYIDPATLTVTVTDPLNQIAYPDVTRIDAGRYAFTVSFPAQGAYYIRVIASLAGYDSANQTFLVDSVRTATYWDFVWGFAGSPSLYAVWIIVVSLVLMAVWRRGRGK